MSEPTMQLLCGIIVALAHTWDAKLPGYRQEFSRRLGDIYMQTPAVDIEVRNALDAIIVALS